MNTAEDTIAAIATAAGDGGICVVRVSGPKSLEVADKVFRCRGLPPSHRPGGTFVYGHITGATEDAGNPATDIDEVLLLIFRAPNSYTREDVVEIQGHGGAVSAQRILRRLLDSGIRLAEPGEFTKRAFLNGRLDLVQAEAVLDLVRASSVRSAAAAMEQLEGSLSNWCTVTYGKLLSLIANLESALDFPDDEMPPLLISQCSIEATNLCSRLDRMLATWDEGHILRDGALTVISGKPNVGKSTLFNALLGVDRAIIADQPGTTRDTIEENLVLNGVLLRLVDTAGLRNASCEIERQGVLRARSQISRADLHIHIIDGSQLLDDTDRTEVNQLPVERTVVVLNKADLGTATKPADIEKYTVISACLRDARDVHNLKITLAAKLPVHAQGTVRATISERHREAISGAAKNITEATKLLADQSQDSLVPAVSLLRSAAESLATLTGRVYHDDLLEQIFSRFCIGK